VYFQPPNSSATDINTLVKEIVKLQMVTPPIAVLYIKTQNTTIPELLLAVVEYFKLYFFNVHCAPVYHPLQMLEKQV